MELAYLEAITAVIDKAKQQLSTNQYLELCKSVEQHCYVEFMEESGMAEAHRMIDDSIYAAGLPTEPF